MGSRSCTLFLTIFQQILMRHLNIILLSILVGLLHGSLEDENSGTDGSASKNESTFPENSGGPMILPMPVDEPGSSGSGPELPVMEGMEPGVPEQSTMPPVDPAEYAKLEDDTNGEDDITGPTTPFDINNMETGVPEGPTKEPYMPKPITKPKPGQNNSGSFSDSTDFTDSSDYTRYTDGSTDYPGGSTDVPGGSTDSPIDGSTDLPIESIPPVYWTKSTPKDFTISQKIDQSSPGYNQLLHMLEDLKHRRKEEEFVEAAQTEFYIDRASTLMDSIESSFTDSALANITKSQEYIKGLLADASLPVRQGYSEIVSLTSQPSFYYIPKRQRYLMVNKIVTDMSSASQLEIMTINQQAKTYCRDANVDTPPYALGNLFGNMLGNGAVLTK